MLHNFSRNGCTLCTCSVHDLPQASKTQELCLPAAAKGCVFRLRQRKVACTRVLLGNSTVKFAQALELLKQYPGTESFSETFGARAMSFFRPALPFLVRISTQFQTIDPKPRKISNQFAEGCVFSLSAFSEIDRIPHPRAWVQKRSVGKTTGKTRNSYPVPGTRV